MSLSNPPQEPTNDLREAELDELLSTLTTPFREWLQPQLETLLARRQKEAMLRQRAYDERVVVQKAKNELIDLILGQLPEPHNPESYLDIYSIHKAKGYNQALSEVTALLNKMKGDV